MATKDIDFTKKIPLVKLEGQTLKKLQDILFMMMCDFKTVCNAKGLTYMLCYGTLLGAVRHQGFIPWDDDVDIMMPREDYEKLAQAYKEIFPDKYDVADPRKGSTNCKIIKVILNGTKMVELTKESLPYNFGIWIDVFPIDNMPKGKARLRAKLFDFVSKAPPLIDKYKYPMPLMEELAKTDKTARRWIKKRKIIGALLNVFFGKKFYIKKTDKLARYKKKTGIMGVPLDEYYNFERYPAEMLEKRIEMPFNGENFYVPMQYEECLTYIYGPDYMTPPANRTNTHPIAVLDFGKYGEEQTN